MSTATRTTLFSSRSSSAVYAELERLESLYLATVRRKLGTDLFFSSGPENVYSIIAYSEAGQTEEVEWLRMNAKGSSQ